MDIISIGIDQARDISIVIADAIVLVGRTTPQALHMAINKSTPDSHKLRLFSLYSDRSITDMCKLSELFCAIKLCKYISFPHFQLFLYTCYETCTYIILYDLASV